MDQSFDPTAMSLDDAADLVAVRAGLGVGRLMREKQALSTGSAALLGGGLGLGTGLISTLMSKKKDEEKQYMRNALLGALLGAGIGGGAGALANNFSAASGNNTPEAIARQKMKDLLAKNQANQGGDVQFGPLGDRIFNSGGVQDVDTSGWSPEDQSAWAQHMQQFKSSGGDPNQLGLNAGDNGLTSLMKKAPQMAEYGGLGYGAGWLYDIARHRMTGGQPSGQPNMQEIVQAVRGPNASAIEKGLKGSQITQPGANNQPSLLEQLRGATVTQERGPARRTPATSIPGPRGSSLNIPSIPYAPGPKVERTQVPDASAPGGVKDLTITPQNVEVLRDTVRANRERSAKPGRGGRWLGLGAGIAGSLFSNQGQQTAPGTAPRN